MEGEGGRSLDIVDRTESGGFLREQTTKLEETKRIQQPEGSGVGEVACGRMLADDAYRQKELQTSRPTGRRRAIKGETFLLTGGTAPN